MTLDILICTYNERIKQVPRLLLPLRKDLRYILSFQYSSLAFKEDVPDILLQRGDIKIYYVEGKGLSKNRNNTMEHATADICLLADDDVMYKPEYIDHIFQTFEQQPDLDVACFRAETFQGDFLKSYPSTSFTYSDRPYGYYPSSVEIAYRRSRMIPKLKFDERFGLGSSCLGCGEEEVWLHQVFKAGLRICYIPLTVVKTEKATTGSRLFQDTALQRAKGAVLYSIYGASACLRTFKFALTCSRQGKASFFSLLYAQWQGIWYVIKTDKR